MKAAIIALIALAFGLSVANAQQTGLLLSQVGGGGRGGGKGGLHVDHEWERDRANFFQGF